MYNKKHYYYYVFGSRAMCRILLPYERSFSKKTMIKNPPPRLFLSGEITSLNVLGATRTAKSWLSWLRGIPSTYAKSCAILLFCIK